MTTNSSQALHVIYPTTIWSLFPYRSQISTGTFWVRWPLLCQSSMKASAACVTDEKRTASGPSAGEQFIRQGIGYVHPCLSVLSPKQPVTETLPLKRHPWCCFPMFFRQSVDFLCYRGLLELLTEIYMTQSVSISAVNYDRVIARQSYFYEK